MRSGFASMLIVAVLFGSGYWYYTVGAVCKVPIAYSIGTIDPNFGLTVEEARAAISGAESVWEDATGRNLFTYDPDAKFTINFVFDERQAEAEAEVKLKEEIDARENKSDSVKYQYELLLQKYEDLRTDYENRSGAYEERLQAYNAEVDRWNKAGGAPQDVFQDLEDEQQALSREQKELNAISYGLNKLVKEMNTIGDEGNRIIGDYNEVVTEYNKRFSEEKEFTQGDYQGNLINIYQFDSFDELQVVLAHEFGHALSLDHIESSKSIMHHFMSEQSLEDGVTVGDRAEFERVCGENSFTLWSIL